MDMMEADVEEKVDYTLFNLMYGFIALLAICALFSLGKAIYNFYRERADSNVASIEDSIDIENQSVPSTHPASDKQDFDDHDGLNSERLHTQLDKLRRLLNRLNAMGTFSRDTIGDLSAQSATYGNHSLAASSDLSNFWSSIDYDDLEESTMIGDNFHKTPTEKSVSLSVLDISLDTSELQYGNNIATTSEKYSSNIVSSVLAHKTNPSDAIDQVLAILDSIMTKNEHNKVSTKNKSVKFKENSDESVNLEIPQPSVRSNGMELFASQQESIPSLSSVSFENKLSFTCQSVNPERVKMPEYKESKFLNAEIESVDITLTSKSKLSGEMSEINSQCKISSTDLVQGKISREIDAVNEFASVVGSKPFPTKVSSSKLENSILSTVSPFVSIFVDPDRISTSQLPESPIKSLVSSKSHLIEDGLSRKISIVTNQRSRSLSSLLDMRYSLPEQPHFINSCSFEKQCETSTSKCGKNPNIVVTVSKVTEDSKCHSPRNNEMLDGESKKYESTIRPIINRNLTCLSLEHVPVPSFAGSMTLCRSSISESDMKPPSYLETQSPSLSSTGSVSFLSPINTLDLSPIKKIDWKSPLEPVLDITLSSGRTRLNEYSISTNTCLWSTPPTP